MNHRLPLLSLATLAFFLTGPARADVESEAAALASRVAAGTLHPDRIEVAALIGHQPAVLALGKRPKAAALERCGREAAVRLALVAGRAAAEHWGGEPAEPISRALAATAAWVACPCDEHAAACKRLEADLEAFTFAQLDQVESGDPDFDARLMDAQRRCAVGMAIHGALRTVERGEDALRVVEDAARLEGHRESEKTGELSAAAQRFLKDAIGEGMSGKKRKKEKPELSPEAEAARDEVVRWKERGEALERAGRDRAMAGIRAAYLPWLLAEPK